MLALPAPASTLVLPAPASTLVLPRFFSSCMAVSRPWDLFIGFALFVFVLKIGFWVRHDAFM